MLSRKVLDEICKILKDEGRDDLVAILVDANDADYVPPKNLKLEYYSDDEGSATDESNYEVDVDEEGFLSIR
jgi:hypothetical protein